MSPLSDCRDTKLLNSKTMTAYTTRPVHSLCVVGTEQGIYGTKNTFSCHPADITKRGPQAHRACQDSCRVGSRLFPLLAHRETGLLWQALQCCQLFHCHLVRHGQWVLRSVPSLGIICQTRSGPPEQTQWCLLLEEKPGGPSNGCF